RASDAHGRAALCTDLWKLATGQSSDERFCSTAPSKEVKGVYRRPDPQPVPHATRHRASGQLPRVHDPHQPQRHHACTRRNPVRLHLRRLLVDVGVRMVGRRALMADPRYYAKLDVGYFDNPKTAELLEEHPRVLILHLRAITYCRQHLLEEPSRCVSWCEWHALRT